MKYIIFKGLGGHYRMTTEENFKSRIWDERKISNWDAFDSPDEIIDYCKKYFKSDNAEYEVYEEV